ncbi:MAG: glycosyltransferase family 9 protein [Ignavibacteria bacterium]|nr:glycosyltransferase family 9 protein [Ignavibacteria bacterium]
MKILINALSGIGDALMFTPALRILKDRNTDLQVDLLAMFESVKQIFTYNPLINEVFFIDFLHQSKIKSIKEVLSIRRRKYNYSINVYPSNRAEYNLLNFFLCSGKRIGKKYNHSHFFRFEFLNQLKYPEIKDRHNVLQNVDLIKEIVGDISDSNVPPMEIFVPEDKKIEGENWILEKVKDRFPVGIHAGSAILKNHINKRWDVNKYIQLCKVLISNKNAFILLFGTEKDLNEKIKSELKDYSEFASTGDFMDSVSRLMHCKLFVSNDTAFLHTCAALQIPVVGIFGYTNFKELYPWKSPHKIVRLELECSPCFFNSPRPARCKWNGIDEFKCIKQISIDSVYQAINELIN